MSKLVIVMEVDTKRLDEAFVSLENKGILNKMRLAIYKGVYKSKLTLLFNIIRLKVKHWIVESTRYKFRAEEEGEDSYIEKRKVALENFLFSDETTLKKNRDYNAFKSDRMVTKIYKELKRVIKSAKSKTQNAAIRAALNGNSVLGFLNMSGITVNWEVKKE